MTTMATSVVETLFSIATCGAETFLPQNGLLHMLTLDAKHSYPWPLAWGNALWGYVAYKMYRNSGLLMRDRPGFVYGCLVTFVLFTMPANIFTNLLIFGRTPSALTSGIVVPIHLVACALVELSPTLFALLSSPVGLAAIDTLGVLDNVTTGFNFLAEMAALTGGKPYASVAAAMTTNLGGSVARHFMVKGFVAGAATFDAAFATNLLLSAAYNSLFFAYTVSACAPVETLDKRGRVLGSAPPAGCAAVGDALYVILPLVMAVKNLLPLLRSSVTANGNGAKHKNGAKQH